MNRLLVVAGVWPERTSSAAGYRLWQILAEIRNQRPNCEIRFASACSENYHKDALTDELRIPTVRVTDNLFHDESLHVENRDLSRSMPKLLADFQPDVVWFDRFYLEEIYGWMVDEYCPKTMKVMDTQDLHFLRKLRTLMVKSKDEGEDGGEEEYLVSSQQSSMDWSLMEAREDIARELGSIYRSDLTFLVSSVEQDILQSTFQVPSSRLSKLSLLYPDSMFPSPGKEDPFPSYPYRRGFVSLGSFRHPPKRDSVKSLTMKIWPEILKEFRARSMDAPELYICGSYASPKKDKLLANLHPTIRVLGHVENQFTTLRNHRVLVSPLRFGAGVKGKIADSWMVRTPVVTTSIGAEDMSFKNEFGGYVCDSVPDFVKRSVDLYSNPEIWQEKSNKGHDIASAMYRASSSVSDALHSIESRLAELENFRKQDWVGSMLKYGSQRYTHYVAKYVQSTKALRQVMQQMQTHSPPPPTSSFPPPPPSSSSSSI